MKRLLRSLCAAAAATAVVGLPTAAFVPAAEAQVALPPVPIPPLPPQLDPLLSIVAPLGQPLCASTAVAAVLGPALFGTVPLPVDVNLFGLFAPVFQVCGELAVPQDHTRYVCAVDDQVAALATLVSGTALGTALPLDSRVLGPLVESLSEAEKQLPADPSSAGVPPLQSTAIQALACRAMGVTATPGPSDDEPADEGGIVDLPASFESGDGFIDASQLLDAFTNAPVESPDLAVAGANRPTTRIIDGRFKYPVIFLLPVLLLVLGGYVGRVVTRPIR